jgi:hypothetical protein
LTRGRDTYSSLENTLVTPVSVCGLLHLLLRSLRVDDAVLACNLVAVALLVVALDALVLVELRLEKGLERGKLRHLGLAGRVTVGRAGEVALEALDTVLDGRVADLGLGNEALQLLRGLAVGAAQGALVQLADVVDVIRQATDVVAQALDAAKEVALRQRRGLRRGAVGTGVVAAIVVVLELVLIVCAGVVSLGVWVWLCEMTLFSQAFLFLCGGGHGHSARPAHPRSSLFLRENKQDKRNSPGRSRNPTLG